MDLTVFENLKQRKKKENRALPTQHTRKSRMLFALFATFTLCGVCFTNPAFAADDPLTIVNNLSDFVFSLIRAVGVILPDFAKSDLFRGVVLGGVLPKKTFSMGHAEEKRYYLECRQIAPQTL